jgi:hypothetical protein
MSPGAEMRKGFRVCFGSHFWHLVETTKLPEKWRGGMWEKVGGFGGEGRGKGRGGGGRGVEL